MRHWLFCISLFFSSSLVFAIDLPASCKPFGEASVSLGAALPLQGYEVTFKACDVKNESWFALRRFSSRGSKYLLVVNSQNNTTAIVAESCLRCSPASLAQVPEGPYKQALQKQQAAPVPLVNAGMTHASRNGQYFLTVDLCPSRRPFDDSIFENVKVRNQPRFPVAISLSGGWMNHYPEEFAGLKQRALDGRLDMVWVNHSYSHPYRHGIPNDRNFLLMPSVNFAEEVLKQEQYMISRGVTPSVFFRFPGLVSNKEKMMQLSSYGLIALGADAWLALGQRPKPGSILLIHANGNEESGVHLFLRMLDTMADLGVFRNLNQAL
jgi:hypothetical protein